MSAFATPSSRLSAVKSVGAGIRLSDTASAAIAATAPDGFDPSKSGAVTALIHAWAADCHCPTGRGKTCQCGNRPAVKVGGKTTDYGRGVDALTAAVRKALKSDDDDTAPVTLRATLSGEGGGSATIPADHPLYAAIVELITGAGA